MSAVPNIHDEALFRIGRRIDAAWKRVSESKSDWVEGSLELMQALGEARNRFQADKAFGEWLKRSHSHITKDDRAALVGMSADLVLARDVLTKTDRRSYRHIWKKVKGRFRHVAKPTRRTGSASRKRTTTEQEQAAVNAVHEGKTLEQAAAEAGMQSVQPAKTAMAKEEGRQEAFQSLLDAAAVKNFTDKGALKIEDAIRIHKTKLDKAFAHTVNEEVQRRIAAADDAARSQNQKLRVESLQLRRMLNERGIFTERQFGQLLMCVHPDNTASTDVRNEMLRLLVANKLRLVKE